MNDIAILPTIRAISKARGRQRLFHFTRASNLTAIAHEDTLGSSHWLDPGQDGERRVTPEKILHQGYSVTINSHLRIAESMMETGTTLEQFRAYLDRHVFFWPTRKDCQKMMATYARREPEESFAVLEFDAEALLTSCHSSVKLSKYDSGSSPRFPKSCNYRKSLAMFLPLEQFSIVTNPLVPTKPSEIKEVLVEGKVNGVSDYLTSVYMPDADALPARWQPLARPWLELLEE